MSSCRTHICTISFFSPLPLILSTILGYGFSAHIFLVALALLLFPRLKLGTPQHTPIIVKALVQETLESEAIQQEKSKQQEEEEEEEEARRRELTDGECKGRLSSTSEESEVDYWPFQRNMFQSPDFLDGGYISDEESLIEIALPGGEFVIRSSCKDHHRQFAIASSFCKQSLMIEEDNLIEIDLSMGSIKCPTRFQIQA
ncbi:unnamed protein product [Linum tenue]|uniref:Uncharacterized protein n=1 Tax=Linum tenue TaxID=586396 RepID=A0AAV0HEI4_9ROSI|nr:unnamed protein product [Linum tenue]